MAHGPRTARPIRRCPRTAGQIVEAYNLALVQGLLVRRFFPDFTLRHPDGFTVLVEVVGFYTPEYLRSKLEALRAAAPRPLVVCVDESLACDDGDVAGMVLRFKKRVDARALISAADRLRDAGFGGST